MKKISIVVKDSSLFFKYRNNKNIDNNLLNTSVFSDNELIFSDEYVTKNIEIVGLFLNDLVVDNNVKSLVLSNNDIALTFVDTFKYIQRKFSLFFKQDLNLTYELCEKLIHIENLEEINCYTIPTYLIELLDRNSIKVTSRNEVLFASKFMMDNNLDSYSKMYYKTSILFGSVVFPEDLDDLKTFCGINKYLKTIHMEKYDKNNISAIARIIYSLRKKTVSIQVHEDINDPDVVAEIKALNKTMYKKYKIRLKLAYSKDYIEKNYGKQMIFTMLKYCSILIFAIVATIFGSIIYNNYKSEKEITKTVDELKAIIGNPEDDDDIANYIISTPEEPEVNEETNTEDKPVTPTPSVEDEIRNKYVNNYDKLLEINSDMVGWLKVNNTKIDYPIVKGSNNSYYLNHNFYKNYEYNGWVFMDYRNNIEDMDTNTILFAHNRYYSGVMFGTLNNVTKESWYTNESNLYITFNTLYKKMKWKIFSIYGIDVTNDYLYTNFKTDKDFELYLDMVRGRSMVDFDTEVTVNDKILTLSTCLDGNRRLVVHAVMVK